MVEKELQKAFNKARWGRGLGIITAPIGDMGKASMETGENTGG